MVIALGLSAQAHNVGRDALNAIRAGRNGAAMPLVRVVFECAVHAQWLVAEPDAADAMFAEGVPTPTGLLVAAGGPA
jgi:hypothetical protein